MQKYSVSKLDLYQLLMEFNAVLVVTNTKTTKYSSETNLWTVLVQAILLEHSTRPAGAFIVCQRFSSQKRFEYR